MYNRNVTEIKATRSSICCNFFLFSIMHCSFCFNCKTLPVHLPEADCSIFTLSVGRRRRLSSRFVTINSTSIKPSMKVRNLTYMHHIIPSASYLTQCIISAPSVHHQSIMSASLVHHHCIIRASSGHHKHIISK